MIAVIVAGGKSSRMGTDKALLPFKDETSLAKYQYNRLNKVFDKVYISAKTNKFDFELNLIKDVHEESSPLVALISIFETIDDDEVFIISVDSPFIDETIIQKLIENSNKSSNITVAKNCNNIEPLCGIYKRSILPLAQKHLQENNHKLQNLIENSQSSFVEFKDEVKFLNLNRPSDYENAKKLTL